MTVQAAATDAATPTQPDALEAPAANTQGEATDTGAKPADDTRTGIDSLPEWAQTELRQARADAAKYRTRSAAADTDMTKLTDRINALEAENRGAKIDAIKARHKISDEDATTFFPREASLEQIEKIAESLAKRSTGPVVPREGTRQGNEKLAKSEEAAFATNLFGQGN